MIAPSLRAYRFSARYVGESPEEILASSVVPVREVSRRHAQQLGAAVASEVAQALVHRDEVAIERNLGRADCFGMEEGAEALLVRPKLSRSCRRGEPRRWRR
jgi:hypothetical protein